MKNLANLKNLPLLYFLVLGYRVLATIIGWFSLRIIHFNALVACVLFMDVALLTLYVYVIVAWCRRTPNAMSLSKCEIYTQFVLFGANMLDVCVKDRILSISQWCWTLIPLSIEIGTLLWIYLSPALREIYPREERRLYRGDKIAIAVVIFAFFAFIIGEGVYEGINHAW